MENKIESESKVKHYWIYFVIVWNIHNLEEAMTMSKWIGSNKDKILELATILLYAFCYSAYFCCIAATSEEFL